MRVLVIPIADALAMTQFPSPAPSAPPSIVPVNRTGAAASESRTGAAASEGRTGAALSEGRTCPDVVSRSITDGLEQEWRVLSHRARCVRRARGWQITRVPVESLDDLLRATGFRVPNDDEHNAALRRLVTVAHTDHLAARIVLQRILPGLVGEARKRARILGSGPWLEEICSWAWIGITTYHTDTRPERVACNLVRDAAHYAFNAPRRRRSWTEAVTDPVDLVAPAGATLNADHGRTDPSTMVEVTALLAEARRRGLTDDEMHLACDLLRAESTETVAVERGITSRAVRYQRARLGQRIRALTDAA